MLWVLVCVFYAQAQPTTSNFRINFKVDQFKIDDTYKETLDKIVSEAKSGSYYEISLSAHTDNDANNQYNINLSKNRAQAVVDYLTSKGLNATYIETQWYGEEKPEVANNNNQSKLINRRVDIELKKFQFNEIADVFKSAGGDYSQTFTLSSVGENIIKGKNGTQITIPKDVLETKDGKAISNENVTIELQEFQKPMDAVFNNLSTICDGKILETGGMFKISATYNGEELQVKNGKSLPVEMPSNNIKPNMELYTGITNGHNATEWVERNIPFEPKRKTPLKAPSTKLDEKYLKTLLQKLTTEPYEYKTTYTLPVSPQTPIMPRKPQKPATVSEEDLYTTAQRFLWTNHKKQKGVFKEQHKREEIYNQRLATYQSRMVKYFEQLNQYYADTVIYKQELDQFYIWVEKEKEKHQKNVNLLEKQLFNFGINRLIAMSQNDKMTHLSPQNILLKEFNINEKTVKQLNLLLYRINLLEWVSKLPKNQLSTLSYYNQFNYASNKVGSKYQKAEGYRINSINQWSYNSFAKLVLDSDSKLAQMFADAKLDLLKKREKLGFFNMNDVSNIYTTAISNLGFINCDKFAEFPQSAMTTIEVETNNLAQVSFYIKNTNSMLSAYQNVKGNYYVNIPKGCQVTMLVVELNQGIPMFEKKRMVVEDNQIIKADTQPITLKEMCLELVKI